MSYSGALFDTMSDLYRLSVCYQGLCLIQCLTYIDCLCVISQVLFRLFDTMSDLYRLCFCLIQCLTYIDCVCVLSGALFDTMSDLYQTISDLYRVTCIKQGLCLTQTQYLTCISD